MTGQSTGEFIRALRLKRAALLLQQGYGNVTQVAYDVGFQSLSYFAKHSANNLANHLLNMPLKAQEIPADDKLII